MSLPSDVKSQLTPDERVIEFKAELASSLVHECFIEMNLSV